MQYVIRNKEVLFAPGKDVFARFRTYQQYHSVMVGIFQLMAVCQEMIYGSVPHDAMMLTGL